jgi:hypothetical protein
MRPLSVCAALGPALVLSACAASSLGSIGNDAGDAAPGAIQSGAPDADRDVADVAPPCPPGQAACDGACVALSSDPTHCGSCGVACRPGEVCSIGVCALFCAGGTMQCGSACVQVQSDPANCGVCGQTCTVGQVCTSGSCLLVCSGGTTKCGDQCVDTRDDPTNCGACGLRCGANAACVNAGCVVIGADAGPACRVGLSACSGRCVDETSDANNCGGCSKACGSAMTCSGGACACQGAKIQCGAACTDVQTDAQNCGACGAACLPLQVCSSGQCACAPSATACGGICIDTAISMSNCGGCAAPCAAGNVCTHGSCTTPTSSWPMFGFDTGHSGFNNADKGIPPAIDQWERVVSSGVPLSPAVVDAGRLYLTSKGRLASDDPIVALSVADGSPLWKYNFGSVDSVGHPCVAGGSVYVETNHGIMGSSYLWSFDAAAGSVRWSAAFDSQWETFWAPIVVGGTVYMDGGEYGGLYAFNVADGSQIFFSSIGQYDSWSPGYFGGSVYSFIAGVFQAEDAASGAALWSVKIPWQWTGYSMNTAPTFGPSLGYVVAPPNLVAIDPAKMAVAWTANGTFTGTPAVADGAVYAVSAGNLVARDGSTGALMWTFVGDQRLSYPPVIANGYVYVASEANVYAVNIATHAMAWSAPVGGWVTLASGRLLVAGPDGVMRGFVLSP